jgi:hypothetical protein
MIGYNLYHRLAVQRDVRTPSAPIVTAEVVRIALGSQGRPKLNTIAKPANDSMRQAEIA